jgi:hypothetical protein
LGNLDRQFGAAPYGKTRYGLALPVLVPAPKGNKYGKGNRNAGKKSLYRPQGARDAK